MFTPHVKRNEDAYGYGWFIPGTKGMYCHGGAGAGFESYFVRRPAQHLYFATLVNYESEHGLAEIKKLEERVVSILTE